MSPSRSTSTPSTISQGLVMLVPRSSSDCLVPSSLLMTSLTLKSHQRNGSTGTAESFCTTTDDDDEDIGTRTSNPDNYSFVSAASHRISNDSSYISDNNDVSKNTDDDDDDDADEAEDDELERTYDGGQSKTDGESWPIDDTVIALKHKLRSCHRELQLKNEEVGRLNRLRHDVESELQELTASLFQEAHNMVREANEKQAAAEKALRESLMKVDVLSAEVGALKTLVLTSTPSTPNRHLHPQIDPSNGACKQHRRSPSHFNLKYGREDSPPLSPSKQQRTQNDKNSNVAGEKFAKINESHTIGANTNIVNADTMANDCELDPAVFRDFLTWRETPHVHKDQPFIQRIYREDIDICLMFSCASLSAKVMEAIENSTILVEACGDRTRHAFPKKCALLDVPRSCYYRMNLGEKDVWYSISQLCRNRIIAVCDMLNYLKYIERGLVKSSVHDTYWEIVRLRKNICLARLGLNI